LGADSYSQPIVPQPARKTGKAGHDCLLIKQFCPITRQKCFASVWHAGCCEHVEAKKGTVNLSVGSAGF
jgi:hypothetical protein